MQQNLRKMKLIITKLALCCALVIPGCTCAQSGFDMTYDFCTDTNRANSVFSAYADTGRFFVFGTSATMPVSPTHGFVASFDYSGHLLWMNKLLYPGRINGASSYVNLIKLKPDRYLVLGTIADQNTVPQSTLYQPYLYIFNNNGDSIMYRAYMDSFLTRNYCSAYSDGNSIVTAGIASNKARDSLSLWLCKYDMAGNLLWEKSYLKSDNVSTPDRIRLSADKQHYAISGWMVDTAAHYGGSCLLVTDTMGNLVSFKRLKRPYDSWAEIDIVTNPSGGYYFAGSYSKLPPNVVAQGSNVYFGKLDEAGDTIWTRTLSDSLYYAIGYHIEWSTDHNHLLIHAAGSGEEVPALIKIDTTGNIVWYHKIQHHYNFWDPWYVPGQVLHGMSVSPNEQYLIGGYTYIGNDVQSWLILADSNGCRYPNDPACWPLSIAGPATRNNEIACYPNPVNDYLNIKSITKGTIIQLFDLTGREVYHAIAVQTFEEINTSSLPPGTYVLQLTDKDGNRVTKKIVKE
jgi:hypothetical protein